MRTAANIISAEPQVQRVIYHTSPRTRATAIDAASMIMKERITINCRPLCGLDGIGYAVLLGFRAAALHPRLYAVARIRGLRTRQNMGNDKL
jgi:hypothetical protein